MQNYKDCSELLTKVGIFCLSRFTRSQNASVTFRRWNNGSNSPIDSFILCHLLLSTN